MRASRRTIAVGLSIFSMLSFGVVGVVVETAGAAVVPPAPAAPNEVVSVTSSLTDPGCPTGITGSPTVFGNIQTAVTAATAGNTIYVCAGDYQLYPSTGTYGANEDILVNKALTIDGPDWSIGAPTSQAVDSTLQAVIDGGSGMLVEAANVVINGLTFNGNNFPTGSAYCGNSPTTVSPTGCSTSIDVQSFANGSGAAGVALSGPPSDQGEPNVTIENNLFVATGANDSYQYGVVHFGLGGDSFPTDVSTLDSGDVVSDNVFFQEAGTENNAVQMGDTTGAQVDGNTVNYASGDNLEISALWFPGYNQATQVDNNVLNGGNIDNAVTAGCSASVTTNCVNTEDPKSGIKFNDADVNGTYGTGCTGQTVSGNTISGFVYDISMISADANTGTPTGCAGPGPGGYTISNNTLSNARLYGVFIDNPTTALGTISGNTVANSDTEYFSGSYFDLVNDSYTTVSYIPGDYDYFDQATPSTSQHWTSGTANEGNGFADPSSIGEVSNGAPPATTTTTSTTTTTTIAPPTTTTVAPTTTTVAKPPVTTTTTLPPKPEVTTSAATLKGTTRVSTTVFCTSATCAGTLELTKTITTKVRIGHTKKYKIKRRVVNLGRTRYAVGPGQSNHFAIRLNATGLKMAKSVKTSRYSCTLVITTSAGKFSEGVSFKKP